MVSFLDDSDSLAQIMPYTVLMDEVNEKWHNTTNFYMSAAAFFDGGLVKEIVARSVSGYGTDLKFL